MLEQLNKKNMKYCKIFKTKTKYKIVTMYKTDTGSYKLLDPIFLLSSEISKEELMNNIFNSLSASKIIVNPNMDTSKELLKKLKESSYKELYKKSGSCMIGLKSDKTILIEPQLYSPEIRSLIVDESKVVEIELKTGNNEISEKIIELLDYSFLCNVNR